MSNKWTKIGGQMIEFGNNRVYVKIRKPIYGTNVAISEKIVNFAKRRGYDLDITTKGAHELISPDDWIKRSRRIEKVFRFPDRPMVLYQATVQDN